MRLPVASGATRTTTLSPNPNQKVVAVASMRPSALPAAAIFHPIFCAASRARADRDGPICA